MLLIILPLSPFNLAALVQAQNTCSNFGSSDQQEGGYTTQRRLVLNFGNTAQCNGTVTAWTYCFHRPRENPSVEKRYSAVFMVYRRTTGNLYNAVPNSMHAVTLSFRYVTQQTFDCRRWNLTDTEQFLIQENDVIGACLFESEPLNMISVNNGANSHVHRSDSYMDCNISAIGEINTADNFERVDTFTLHLQAHIREFTIIVLYIAAILYLITDTIIGNCYSSHMDLMY